MATSVSVAELGKLLAERDDFALLDVRETAEYNLAHIGGSCSLPRRQIEFRLADLVPYRGTRIVLCDDDGRRATLAAATLAAMGYGDVGVLAGGLNRWVTDGGSTEWGVNVPSKDFGEKVLLTTSVPEIEPDELQAWLARGDAPIMLDSRTPEEHQRSCIPGSRSMPGAELGLRAWELLQDPDRPVVVHCAGRTRSIIGAATLQRMGVKNVFALKNGTMGWQLAGLELETGSPRLDLPAPSPANIERAGAIARELASKEGVHFIDVAGLEALRSKASSENVYLIDVRTREEYAAGHIPGFRWVPGGQAVQASDNYVAVRGAQLVFACDGIVRAAMTASWFRQMGFANVYAVDGGTMAWQAVGRDLEAGAQTPAVFGLDAARAAVAAVSATELASDLAAGKIGAVIHVGTSDEFSQGHVAGSAWLPRSWLELRASGALPDKTAAAAVTCADGVESALAAAALQALGYERAFMLDGGIAAWRAAGLPLERGLTGVTQAPDDVLPARRSYAEMLNYLRWEEELGHKYAGQK